VLETLKMRTLNFALAFALVLAGTTLAGSHDGSLPGIGTFAYGGATTVAAASSVVVATR
jgi:hypothetical protein